MKCPKCGYISFDYLSNCKRCHTDLASVRQIIGVLAVGVGASGVLLQSSVLSGEANAQAEFLFNEGVATEETGFEFEGTTHEGISPVADMEEISDEVAGMEEPVLDLTGDTGDLEEIQLELSGTQEELSFEPGLDTEAVDKGTEGLDLELDIPTAELSTDSPKLADEKEFELAVEPAEVPEPPMDLKEPSAVEVPDFQEELRGLADEPVLAASGMQEQPLRVDEKGAEEISPKIETLIDRPVENKIQEEVKDTLQASDLEEELSDLIGEPIVTVPETRPETIFDVSNEKLEDLPLELDTEYKAPADAKITLQNCAENEKIEDAIEIPDLEEELSALVDEKISVEPQSLEESIFDLSDEPLTNQPLADLPLEELGKDEIFQDLVSEAGEPSLVIGAAETNNEDLSVVDLDLDSEVDMDMEDLTREVEQSLQQLAEETDTFASDEEILASIPSESKD